MSIALVQSFTLVGLAEMGDKTQLLSMMLAARYRRFTPIILGILAATFINHGFTAWLGSGISNLLDPRWMNPISSAMLIVTGLWTLIPDSEPDAAKELTGHGIFYTTLITFFLAEMGDKTQLATLTLGAQYLGDTWHVIFGTTLGMLAANVPAVLFGHRIIDKLPIKLIHITTCLLFIGLGFYGLREYL